MTNSPSATKPRKSLRIRTFGIVLAALGLAGAGAYVLIKRPWDKPPPAQSQPLTASLELAAGEVFIQGENGEKQQLQAQAPLLEGAIVQTKAGARALIRLGDGSRVFLSEHGQVKIGAGIELLAGKVWLDTPPLEQEQSPTMHILGNSSLILANGGGSLQRNDSEVEVYVAEGLAILTSPGGRKEIASGEKAKVRGDEAPVVEAIRFWEDWTGGMSDRRGLGRSFGVGVGSLYAVDRQAPPGAPALPLTIQRQTVHAVIRDSLVETKVDQVFFNPSGRVVEGYYWFTVPPKSQLVGFALESNGTLVDGEIVERSEAKKTYERAIERDVDPALLEWIDERTVRARIYPVPGLGNRRIVVRYQQILPTSEGKLHYVYPLAGPQGSEAPTIEEFSLRVDLGELAKDYEVTTLSEARVEDNGRLVTMRRSGYVPRADFELELVRKPGMKVEPLRVNLFDPGGDQAQYLMLRYTPDVDFTSAPPPKAEVVLVVDTSAAGDISEHRTKLAATEAILRSLSQDDRFAIMSADLTSTVLFPEQGLAQADPDAISQALERLSQYTPGGASNLGMMFEKALERVHGLEQPAIIYIGDGMATSGERTSDAIAERLQRSIAGSRARLFTMGVGQESHRSLLARLARIGGGQSFQIDQPEQAVLQALELAGAIKTPTITELLVDLGEGLDDVMMNVHGKLSRGEELLLLARTHHDLPKEVSIRGALGGKKLEQTYPIKYLDDVTNEVVPRLWAHAFVDRLLADSDDPNKMRGKILSLGLEYGLMTPFTSFLALESEHAYVQSGIERRRNRLGDVRLTDASHILVPSKVRGQSGAWETLVAIASAPIGCNAKESAPTKSEVAEEPPAVTAKTQAASAPSFVRTPDGDASENQAESPLNALKDAAKPTSVSEVASEMPEGEKGDSFKTEFGNDKNAPAEDDDAPPLGTVTADEEAMQGASDRRSEVRSAPNKKLTQRVLVKVKRGGKQPCSDASLRSLSQRSILWQKRLASAETMVDALTIFEAAAASCEIKRWEDERIFLRLLQKRVRSEQDIEELLYHFADEHDAQAYLARALLRRLVDANLIAAVESAMFGEAVNWQEIDRELALATNDADKLAIVRQALLRSPEDPQGENRLIKLLISTGKIEEAIARARRLREQGLMTPGLIEQVGELLASQNDALQARRIFSEIVEFDPHNPQTRSLLGNIFLYHRWYEDAYYQYQDLVAVQSEDSTTMIRLAQAAAGTGRLDEALRLLRKIANGPGRPGVDDPRRWARLHAAVYLASLYKNAEQSGVSKQSLERELKRLQLFDVPTTWILLTWEDFSSALIWDMQGELANSFGDVVESQSTGLYALQSVDDAAFRLNIRNRQMTSHPRVAYKKTKIHWDGKAFTIEQEDGEWVAEE